MNWPTNLLDPSYGSSLLAAVTSANYELSWVPLEVGPLKLLVTARPLRVEGVFVNVSATLQQQIADALGAMLPTPKLMDLMWLARAATIAPFTMPIAATSAAMLSASEGVDGRITTAGDPSGILVLQKTWCIGNSLAAHPGRAMNYGFFCIPNQANNAYSGINTEACVSISNPQQGRVIQGQGWAHDSSHLDYSQWCPLVHRSCMVNDSPSDLVNVLQDATLASLISHEGPLTVLRQPGVPMFSCPTSRPSIAFSVPADMCPTPAPPQNIENEKGPNWGLVGLTAAAVGAAVFGFWAMLRHAGRHA